MWSALASGIETENKVRAFFTRRQQDASAGQQLRIQSVVKVENARTLGRFQSAGSFDNNPRTAHQQSGDTFLFHGTNSDVAANIQATGLLMQYSGNGMLGRGLYGAPDPRKSYTYCRTPDKFMFICRFDLASAQHAGPNTNHRNSVFHEYCVYDERHVVVLWMLKLA